MMLVYKGQKLADEGIRLPGTKLASDWFACMNLFHVLQYSMTETELLFKI